ncbi:hypothetical protein COO59_15920 [Mixta theicola]|uniref:Uncharacterized protein n=1 Tax=Mixta theicola TaxID=1458355 RepID=A0A2K1Q6H5_9GAMM|nr:hypothetical protein [Mixta theicola]PNS10611.1 hypothetical protein COO59_15920 [Mixta theicola]GLR11011.1 hypothetical protein GCM10007905_37310 [Mixta theicola]
MFIKKLLVTGFLAVSVLSSNVVLAKASRLSDDQVKQKVIDESIEAYPGTCACPFNTARNGSHCGRRSAWSKEGGYAPVCYKNEITQEMISAWRKEHNA